MSKSVLIAEDFEPIRQVLVAMINSMPDIRIVSEVADGSKAVEKANDLHPDLILLDIGLPSLNGIDAARQIRHVSPQSKIIFVSQEIATEAIQEALGTGASGYVVKVDAGRELVTAIQAVLRGEQFLSNRAALSTVDLQTSDTIFPSGLPPQKLDAPRLHEIQFYSSHESFISIFAQFAGPAIKAGDAVVVIVTEFHRDRLIQRLNTDGLDIAASSKQGRFIYLDPFEMLSAVMVNGLPDRDRFMRATEDVILPASSKLAAKHNCVALCGECAPILWSQGNAKAAIRLEQLWNEIVPLQNVHLLCAYPSYCFQGEVGRQAFDRVCAEHSAVYSR